MSPEKRLILSAALLAVAQQDQELVKLAGVRPSRSIKLRAAISSEAALFVASDGFDEMMDQIDIEADRLRRMSPKQALDAYTRLTSDNWRDFSLESNEHKQD